MGPVPGDTGDRQVPRRTDRRTNGARGRAAMNVLAFARELIDIDSTTGTEQAAADWLATRLRGLGYQVEEQPVSDGRRNIVATLDEPVVVLSTHFDCVPPHIPSSVRDGRLYGRGACDAKGI